MDFNSILSLAAQNSSSGNKIEKKFSTDLGPPRKEKKEKTVKSEAIQKLLQEKEREKRKIIEEKEQKRKAKEEAIRRKKEKEKQRQKEEEKRNRFRIPKKNDGGEEETGKSGDSKSKTESKSKNRHHKNDKNSKSKDKNSKSDRKDLVITPNEVRITALSNHSRESHINHQYDFLLKKEVDMKVELEKELKRREFEEKRAKLIEKMKEGLSEEKEPKKDKVSKEEKEEKRRKERELKRNEQHRERELNGETVRKRRKGMTDEELKEWLAKGDSDKGDKVDKVVKKEKISDHSKPSTSKPLKSNTSAKKPPPMGFGDLLKLAQEKSTDVIDTNPFCPAKPKKVEIGRLLTQAEKDRKQDELRHRSQKSQKPNHSQSESVEVRHKSGTSQGESSEMKHRTGVSKSESSDIRHKPGSSKGESSEMRRKPQTSQSGSKLGNHNTQQNKKEQDMLEREREILRRERELLEREKEILRKEKEDVRTKSDKLNGSSKSDSKHSKNSISKSVSSSLIRDNSSGSKRTDMSKPSSSGGGSRLKDALEKSGKSSKSKSSSNDDSRHYDCENENVLVCGPSKAEKKTVGESQNPWDRIYGQIKKNHPTTAKRRRVESYSDESDYDEDMEGFIEDEASDVEEVDETDYSAHIRQIFGYDRRKFRYESDHEIKNMETNFREQMKEEARSARLGLMEDLEDIKREEEEMKRKMQAKKRKK